MNAVSSFSIIPRGNIPGLDLGELMGLGKTNYCTDIPICPRTPTPAAVQNPRQHLNPRKVKKVTCHPKIVLCTGLVAKGPDGKLGKVPRLAVRPEVEERNRRKVQAALAKAQEMFQPKPMPTQPVPNAVPILPPRGIFDTFDASVYN